MSRYLRKMWFAFTQAKLVFLLIIGAFYYSFYHYPDELANPVGVWVILAMFFVLSAILTWGIKIKGIDREGYEVFLLHPHTHAILALMCIMTVLLILSMILFGDEVLSKINPSEEIDYNYPFLFVAFFAGTLGGCLGVFQRLSISDADQEAKLESLFSEQVKGKVMAFHQRLVSQVYLSIAVGGILGVVGIILCHALGEFASGGGFLDKLLPTLSAPEQIGVRFIQWLELRPEDILDFSKALVVAFLSGYSERMIHSVLATLGDKVESLASELDHNKN